MTATWDASVHQETALGSRRRVERPVAVLGRVEPAGAGANLRPRPPALLTAASPEPQPASRACTPGAGLTWGGGGQARPLSSRSTRSRCVRTRTRGQSVRHLLSDGSFLALSG